MKSFDTIAAIATGNVISAIGIVRISGSEAIVVAQSAFRMKSGLKLKDAQNRQMYYGELSGDDGGLIDLCFCTVSRAPYSYTGEDTVEFHCHGSPIVLSEVLRVLFSKGVRQAKAGEFTMRAFLNGRMDLTQAEAVIDLIEAETPLGARNAAGQLRGAFSEKIDSIYNRLVDIMAHFHAVIDYSDEDIDEFELRNYLNVFRAIESELDAMLQTHERGRIMREGVPTAIVGRANTGKSSILNALLGYNRAIVNEAAGTTRDTIEEKVLIGNVLLRLIDTAGLRKTSVEVEKLGIERTLNTIESAGLILLVLDGSEPLKSDDFEVLSQIPKNVPTIAVVNKSDLPSVLDCRGIGLCTHPCRGGILPPETPSFPIVHISAKTGDGLPRLESMIQEMFPELDTAPSGELITSVRQAEAIARAIDSLRLTMSALSERVTPDAALTDIEAALSAIGELTGKTIREDIVFRIFERFCVGK